MPIPTEGLGEKRYRAALVKSQPDMTAAQKLAAEIVKADAKAEKIAAAAVKLNEVLTPAGNTGIVPPHITIAAEQAVEVDQDFEAEFAALEAQEAEASKEPIKIEDPHNAAPTHARTTIVNGQKVIDMGSVKITATPEGITVERPPVPQEEEPERFVPPLSAKTLAEMAAGREALAKHKARKPPAAPEEPPNTQVGSFPDFQEYMPLHKPARSKDGR